MTSNREKWLREMRIRIYKDGERTNFFKPMFEPAENDTYEGLPMEVRHSVSTSLELVGVLEALSVVTGEKQAVGAYEVNLEYEDPVGRRHPIQLGWLMMGKYRGPLRNGVIDYWLSFELPAQDSIRCPRTSGWTGKQICVERMAERVRDIILDKMGTLVEASADYKAMVKQLRAMFK